ncbi:TPA: hypothetical protein IAC10_10265 [Candidatus Scatousia excrementigallinarum]|uniref:Uncharacterized protein n=1 Tax=Candidatus Scatousia excrementigallinarum TaxID=2840935 RepID=A0A9D1JNI8_9BACT|nr:hypothetical protein [Candidatus Scatousia excrementigallinarum]
MENLYSKSEFYPETNGEISNSITKSWTEQALECYSIGCDCSKCSLKNGNYSFVCQMPKVIDILIGAIGKPRMDMA